MEWYAECYRNGRPTGHVFPADQLDLGNSIIMESYALLDGNSEEEALDSLESLCYWDDRGFLQWKPNVL